MATPPSGRVMAHRSCKNSFSCNTEDFFNNKLKIEQNKVGAKAKVADPGANRHTTTYCPTIVGTLVVKRTIELSAVSKETSMPRFFFQIVDPELVPDEEGTELPDLTAACRDATDILAERLKGSGNELWQARRWDLEITDTTGKVMAVLTVTARLII